MALLNRLDALCAPVSGPSPHFRDGGGDSTDLTDFESELKRLSAVNDELMRDMLSDDTSVATPPDSAADPEELELLRQENAELRLRLQELEALGAGEGDELWLERQREYEMLLEEKSEVIRGLHQQIHESQALAGGSTNPADGGAETGQAEEILRLKREMDEQRKQLDQDEADMMAQMRQMEMQMAKERAEMARQRLEVQRQKAELAREIENAARDPELHERLKSLRRPESRGSFTLPPVDEQTPKSQQNSSGFFRRIFG